MLTAHDVLPREPQAGPARRPAQALRADGRDRRALRARRRAAARRARPGPGEGPRDPARRAGRPRRAPCRAGAARFAETRAGRAVLRPDPAVQGRRRAARRVARRARPDAELWVVGMPRMDASLHPRRRACARRCAFVSGAELAGAFEAADLVVLPYREIDQSGVLFTALAFGKPLLLSAVGGFAEIATGRRARAAGRPGRAGAGARAPCSADPARARADGRRVTRRRRTAPTAGTASPSARSRSTRRSRRRPGGRVRSRPPGAARCASRRCRGSRSARRRRLRERVVLVDDQLDQRRARARSAA